MHPKARKFAKYCEQHFDLEKPDTFYLYRSLPICLVDCVYSLRTKYSSVTLPLVQRYADAYLGGDKTAEGDTLSQFLQHVEEAGGPKRFADRVLNNHQKLGGKAGVPKEEVCCQLARYLRALHIETLEDFRVFPEPEVLEIVIRAVKGMGHAGCSYLFMLTGDCSRCKPDVHIHHCIRDALGQDLADVDCQRLFEDAARILQEAHPALSVRSLDGAIWEAYRA